MGQTPLGLDAGTPASRARAERLAQGLPPTVTDPAVYARLAVILKNADAGAPASVSRDACGGTVTATSDGDAAA